MLQHATFSIPKISLCSPGSRWMVFGLRRVKVLGYMSMQLVSKISNLCDPDPPTSQTDGRTDRRTTCNLNTALCTSASRGKNWMEFHWKSLTIPIRSLMACYWQPTVDLMRWVPGPSAAKTVDVHQELLQHRHTCTSQGAGWGAGCSPSDSGKTIIFGQKLIFSVEASSQKWKKYFFCIY